MLQNLIEIPLHVKGKNVKPNDTRAVGILIAATTCALHCGLMPAALVNAEVFLSVELSER